MNGCRSGPAKSDSKTLVTVMAAALALACGSTDESPDRTRGAVPDAPMGDAGDAAAGSHRTHTSDLPGALDPLGGLAALTDARAVGTDVPEPWPVEPPPPGWTPADATSVDLEERLTLVTAIAEERGDYESVKQISAADGQSIEISFSTRGIADALGVEEVTARRTVLRTDLETARSYRMVFGHDDPPVFPGSTALGVSRAVLEELRSTGAAELRLVAPTDLLGAVISSLGLGNIFPAEGRIVRNRDVPPGLPVLVNGERVWLPTLHVRGTLQGLVDPIPVQFWFLDDLRNPLTLRAAVGTTRLQMVRIDRPGPFGPSDLEQALSREDEAVELFGVYFAFASAEILPESGPVLDEIAELMRRHPDWRLAIEGHTDSIGTPTRNLELSRQRAGAVVEALVERLGGGEDRLESAGYGEARPVETNETLEGRARNRRVVLRRR